MIRYVGNPYVDAGVAVLEHRLKKSCASFTADDLDSQAQTLEREYGRPIWKSYLTIHFPNSAWVQPRISPEKKRAYINIVLGSYKADSLNPPRRCPFCGQPAQAMVDRSHFPLLTGETIMATGANGQPGLPICGYCIFAVQFYPLATLKVGGRPLFWWAPEAIWTRALTRRFYQDVESVLAVSSDKFLNLRWPSTQLLRAAKDAVEETNLKTGRDAAANQPPFCDLIGVHATNFGSGPDYDELRIPRRLLEFWSEARTFGDLYQRIEQQAWDSGETKSKKRKNGVDEESGGSSPVPELARRNRLYEALGEAFRKDDFRDSAKRIARRFFLKSKGKSVEPNTIALAEFFLEKVAYMDKPRLEAIREIADTIADQLILAKRDTHAADQLFRRRLRLGEFMRCLSQAQRKLSDAGHPLAYERVLLALGLQSEDDTTSTDSWLVQELILIRLYERLANSPMLVELPEPTEEALSDAT